MFPAITHVGIPVDQNHDSTFVVENRVVCRIVNTLLAVIIVSEQSGNHLWPIDVLVNMEDFVVRF